MPEGLSDRDRMDGDNDIVEGFRHAGALDSN